MTSEREILARDIWRAGVTDPDLLAEWLIREGWAKRNTALAAGALSVVSPIHAINPPIMNQMPARDSYR